MEATLPEFITTYLREPREHAFSERLGDAEWRYTSSTRMLQRAQEIARGLRASGVKQGDRVSLISNNRVDWIAADFGILLAGAIPIPSYATIAHDQLDFIFRDAEPVLAFAETHGDAERIREHCPAAPRVLSLTGEGEDTLAALEARGADAGGDLASYVAGQKPDDLAVLIYTSGTTGDPKGVMLSHRNLIASATNAFDFGLANIETAGQPVLSVLPFAHIFEHTDVLGYVRVRYNIAVSLPDLMLLDMRSVRPFAIAVVPRILERILAAVVGTARAAGGEQAKMVPWALDVGRRYMDAKTTGADPGPELSQQYAAAQAQIFPKIREALGLDRLRYFVSGSAPLHRDVALTFAAMGLEVGEGYGLTETSPTISVTQVGVPRYGTVGKVIPGMHVKIADDGEILVRGDNVMLGYYKVGGGFTDDGWFMTGDIGQLDADGFLTITDRKKELLKTSGGKYVAPSRVESAIRRSFLVSQCLVVGEGRPFPIALIVPDWTVLRGQLQIPADLPTAEIAVRPDVQALVRDEVARQTAEYADHEQIRRVAVLPRDLTVADGDLSPAMKVRRRIVEQRFAGLIESTYAARASTSSA